MFSAKSTNCLIHSKQSKNAFASLSKDHLSISAQRSSITPPPWSRQTLCPLGQNDHIIATRGTTRSPFQNQFLAPIANKHSPAFVSQNFFASTHEMAAFADTIFDMEKSNPISAASTPLTPSRSRSPSPAPRRRSATPWRKPYVEGNNFCYYHYTFGPMLRDAHCPLLCYCPFAGSGL